jgi:hypothetical protein
MFSINILISYLATQCHQYEGGYNIVNKCLWLRQLSPQWHLHVA